MSTVRLFPTEPERPAFRLPIAWGVGLALLAESLGSSVVLVMQHLQGLELPGWRKASGDGYDKSEAEDEDTEEETDADTVR